MQEVELKSCPFCGGEVEICLIHHDGLYVVGCHTPMCYGNINHFTMVFTDANTAARTWNTRKPMERIVEQLEELRIPYRPQGTMWVECEKDANDVHNEAINKARESEKMERICSIINRKCPYTVKCNECSLMKEYREAKMASIGVEQCEAEAEQES